jgi:hypothetical protein
MHQQFASFVQWLSLPQAGQVLEGGWSGWFGVMVDKSSGC